MHYILTFSFIYPGKAARFATLAAGENAGTRKAIRKNAVLSSFRQLHSRRQHILKPYHSCDMPYFHFVLAVSRAFSFAAASVKK